ncbi:MAG: RNA 2',3'-cyclic phosphodiesterase [Chitinivibrionales bacterium]|nr:RNA 2',3'-cyclic phosphodiesterase [Chitinivibrionales bacterium]MBD3394944.1 RNA 2',3'-cyclic phosphodiesterase [Chitinivibrionales bacterium]
MYRLFVAIDLPSRVLERIAGICHGVRGARWVPQEQLHLTLRFIGEVNGSQYDDIVASLEQVQYRTFPLRLAGTGYFPPKKAPRVLWVGIEENGHVRDLFQLVENALHEAGIAREKRKFSPHVTVARLRDRVRPADVAPFLSHTGLFKTEPVQVNEIHLYSSVLRPEGALHRKEASYALY